MDNQPAIRFSGVHKRYRMGGGLREKLVEAIGLNRWSTGAPPSKRQEFDALHDISFEVPRGRRYGMIGRNGAGKTTLLKLISGNFAPTAGKIEVNGSVQALMTMGHGFHPDYTGRDNILASLQYNGLSRSEFHGAVDDILDFCELGLFIDQPFKTYSSGMQARLMFAVATAVRPDILIVDEILGAGDAYFIAKSRRRVDKLVGAGCTLLLVSHSMGQVLELCEHVIWLDAGRVRKAGPAFEVVKAYEGWMHGSIERLDSVIASRTTVSEDVETDAGGSTSEPASLQVVDHSSRESSTVSVPGSMVIFADQNFNIGMLQDPVFQPHLLRPQLPVVNDDESRVLACIAPGGVSRWRGEPGLRVTGVSIAGPQGPTNRLVALQPASFSIFLESEMTSDFRCRYGIIVHDLRGRTIARIWSQPDHFSAARGEGRRIDILLNPNQLGPGTYTLGISILGETELELVNSAHRYDLLGRSFLFEVELPSSLSTITAEFFHSAEWQMRPCVLSAAMPELSNEERAEISGSAA